MFARLFAFLYGLFCYLIFFATFLYAIGFIGNFAVPSSLDSAPRVPLATALITNILLLMLFALQHSIMARQWFKSAWTKLVPTSVERSTYVFFSSAALLLLFWKWQPIGGIIWHVENPIAHAALIASFALGWVIVLLSTALIDHFDLFGLRQVWFRLLNRPYTPPGFRTPFLYRYVRHPLYVGWILVFWSTSRMTSAHLLFALATTAYILVAIQFEERDLVRLHREYADYRRRVPMLIPSANSYQLPAAELPRQPRPQFE